MAVSPISIVFEALAAEKLRGLCFTAAWDAALELATGHGRRRAPAGSDRADEIEALRQTRDGWERAFSGEPALKRERAVVEVLTSLGGGSV